MVQSDYRLKKITASAIIAFLTISVIAFGSDFFPLDAWEEMEDWGQIQDTTNVFKIESHRISSKTFPFDVREEIEYMGGIEYTDFKNFHKYNKKYGIKKEDKTNHYWLPEIYREQ